MINPYAPPSTQTESLQLLSSRPRPWSTAAIVVFGVLVPGLPSLKMRRSAVGIYRFLVLLLMIPVGFAFFGPFWGEILFAGTTYAEAGLYPFVATCFITPVLSVWCGFRDRQRLLKMSESPNADSGTTRRFTS